MIYLVSFASPIFEPYRDQLNASALQYGIDRVISYSPSDLAGTAFASDHQDILQEEKGYGLWLWKPYILLDALTKAEENAVIVYSDADNRFIRPVEPLISLCANQGGFAFFKTMSYLNKSWTKRDCFVLMQCDEPDYWNAEHIWAGFFIFHNNESSRKLLQEWLSFCVNKSVLLDGPNGCGLPNFPEFTEHRYDQSVLSLLTAKYGLPVTVDLYHDYLLPDRKSTPE